MLRNQNFEGKFTIHGCYKFLNEVLLQTCQVNVRKSHKRLVPFAWIVKPPLKVKKGMIFTP